MEYLNQFSDKFMDKFLIDSGLVNITKRSFFKTIYYYIIDSKERIQKKLDLTLKEQISNPAPELVEVAKKLFIPIKDPDKRIIIILRYVYSRVKYTSDIGEKWSEAIDVWSSQKDDCDGKNSLIYVLARLSGITDLCLWSILVDTADEDKLFDHYALLYFSPKKGNWYSIDGTYYPNFTEIDDHRSPFIFTENKYQTIWFMFNESKIYKQIVS